MELNFFFDFRFLERVTEVKIFVNIRPICAFLHSPEFLPKLSSNLLKYGKIVNKVMLIFFQDKKALLTF